MQVEYTEQFVKDLKALRSTPYYAKIHKISFDTIPLLDSWTQIPHMIKMEGFNGYYRIKQGDYRIGVKIEGDLVVFQRVLHRKEVYRFFP